MHVLSRTVRFHVPIGGALPAGPDRYRAVNGHGGWPSATGLGVWGAITVRCAGEPDPTTGYLVNIAHIDRAVRGSALPVLAAAVRERSAATADALLVEMSGAIARDLEALAPPVRVHAVTWHLTPQHRLTLTPPTGADPMERVIMTQEFSFSAAHRLHVDRLSDAENRATFGKCNNPNGHGHNYRLDVAVSYPLDQPLPTTALEAAVAQHVIEPLDHRHLNLDVPDFAHRVASVEVIAQVCHGRLAAPIAALGGRLEHVTVWETDKTSCRYPGTADRA